MEIPSPRSGTALFPPASKGDTAPGRGGGERERRRCRSCTASRERGSPQEGTTRGWPRGAGDNAAGTALRQAPAPENSVPEGTGMPRAAPLPTPASRAPRLTPPSPSPLRGEAWLLHSHVLGGAQEHQRRGVAGAEPTRHYPNRGARLSVPVSRTPAAGPAPRTPPPTPQRAGTGLARAGTGSRTRFLTDL